MSKKTPVKKSKRRLKRSVRRSLAAVLMITAIGVAAIPVPENYAENTGYNTQKASRAADVHDTVTDGFGYKQSAWTETEEQEQTKTDADGKPVMGEDGKPVTEIVTVTDTKKLGVDEEMVDKDDKAAGFSLDAHVGTATELLKDKDVEKSLTITEVGGALYLGWQFMYYEVTHPDDGMPAGVICKYNPRFLSGEGEPIDLSMNPIREYYVVEQKKIDAYFTAGTDDDTKALHIDYGMAGMDDWDPTKAKSYTYQAYVKDKAKDENARSAVYKYLNKYFPDRLAGFEAYEAWLADEKNVGKDYEIGGIKIEEKDLTLTITVADDFRNDASRKLQFYNEHDSILSQYGYTLKLAYDNRPDGSNKQDIYVAYGGTDPDQKGTAFDDGNGYLAVKESDYLMCGIGNEACKDVTNVYSMTIPIQIAYIGDEAFAGATMMTEVSLGNVQRIGNRAFKNCTSLAKVTFSQKTEVIGAECFYSTAITTLDLPYNVNKVGYGAFANCGNLTEIKCNQIPATKECVVKDYAFYNCTALTTVEMADSGIKQIGKGAFAVEVGGAPLDFTFPANMKGSYDGNLSKEDYSIGDYMFANRSTLGYVIFPQNYGTADEVDIPDSMFHGCAELQYVKFPVDKPMDVAKACGYASYDPEKLFADVINPDFYVQGPKTNYANEAAKPRQSTWDAETAVSETIPYLYIENGKELWEVSDGKYLLRIRKDEGGGTGVLESCTFKPGASGETDIELKIPATVGNTKVVGIEPGCFSDKNLNQEVISLKIEDDSISTIGDGVFKGWGKLETVYIGNSVTEIGTEAFKDCKRLADVTFNTPLNGAYDTFTIKDNAFESGNTIKGLTFHGDIVEKYAPFVWAMGENYVDRENNLRICYKSLSPSYLTVMRDANTGLVTLLDYPKYSELDDMPAIDPKYKSHRAEREAELTAKYSAINYAGKRTAFAKEWQKVLNGESEYKNADQLYATELYGPWVTEDFCPVWEEYVKNENYESTLGSGSTEDNGDDKDKDDEDDKGDEGEGAFNSLVDLLFEPITVYAVEDNNNNSNPTPYYKNSQYRYSVIKNYENDYVFKQDYESNTKEEYEWINAALNLVVPAGIESVDVKGFMGAKINENNRNLYFAANDSLYMYYLNKTGEEGDPTKLVPGLFSGFCVDYELDDDDEKSEYEQWQRGNDRLETVTLTDVQYLPDYAFDSCENLKEIVLGDKCSDIGTAPFRGCYSLTTVGSNQWYETVNGVVYSKETRADGGTDYTIEECLASRGNILKEVGSANIPADTDEKENYISNVTTIKDGAFQDCDYVNMVDLSTATRLNDIPKDCFRDCNKLQTITLPSTVKKIDAGAFVDTIALNTLRIPGKEVFISGEAFEEDKDEKYQTTKIVTSKDSSAYRYAETYGSTYNLVASEKNAWTVIFLDIDGKQLGETQYIEPRDDDEDGGGFLTNGQIPDYPTRSGYEYKGWLSTNGKDTDQKICEDTIFVAQGYYADGSINGQWPVNFYDGITLDLLDTQLVYNGENATPPTILREYDGLKFLQWSEDYTNVTKPMNIFAVYGPDGSTGTTSGTTTTSGSTTTTSGSTTTTSDKTTNTSSSSSTTTSGSSTSTTSAASATPRHTVTVVNGFGSGSYAEGETVIIVANEPAAGQKFAQWRTESEGVELVMILASATTFVMPANNVIVTAEFTAGAAPASTTPAPTIGTVSTNPGNTSSNNNGNTRVDITKPGISNKNLATANVNGSTDNFIVKISETPEATQAVVNALANKYGNLDNILYYAMDISLYDSTGTTKITDTTGLSVDITMPIPDALVAYGGNNMMGAVVASNQLEDMSERFTTIGGVPCISFTATHFSPYTIYVNTQNLSEGLLDVTPKTGDPIHPKWFLSIGLAALSVLLFMKKDKKTTVKTA